MINIKAGDFIVCHFVDPYGFTGRDNHPQKSDVGDEFYVVKVENITEQEKLDCGPLWLIRACSPGGTVRDFLDHEVKLNCDGNRPPQWFVKHGRYGAF